jgi:hypothetical protein
VINININEKLMNIQTQLKAPKNQNNTFGKYKYRSCEDILEALKPLLATVKATVTLSDTIEHIGDRFYVKATATLTDTEKGEKIEVSALAREDENKKGMDLAQVTGSVSSYSRKYALNGMFCIDDTKDSDATNEHGKSAPKQYIAPTNKTPYKAPQPTEQVHGAIISEPQQRRLYAVSKGNNELAKKVLLKYNYTSSKLVENVNYKKICDEIEQLVSASVNE